MKDPQARKWQITINNPQDKQFDHDKIKLCLGQLKSAVYYCMANEVGLESHTPHTHIFIQLKSPAKFSRIKKLFPDAHIEQAHGSPSENRDYIAKSGRWADDPKADTSTPGTFEEWGELPEEPGQGSRTDLQKIAEMLADGMTPGEIMAVDFSYRRYERMIKSAYFDRRKQNTPVIREVKVHYLVGESGSGKSYTYVSLCEEHGEDQVYFFSDYEGGGWDAYQGEPILFLDELKGQFPFSLLLQILDKFKTQLHARYSNVVALWREVYITSVFPPEELYKKMVEESARGRDKQQQFLRRISDITYCYIDEAGNHQRYTIPMSQYKDYETMKQEATTPDWVREIEADEMPPEQIGLPF